jgi:hypothetical protein
VSRFLSRKTPWTLASFVLAGSSVGLLLLWFASWDLPAGPEILASPVLLLSLVAAISGITAAFVGIRKSERGLRTVIAAVACVLAGAPAAALLLIWLFFTAQ